MKQEKWGGKGGGGGVKRDRWRREGGEGRKGSEWGKSKGRGISRIRVLLT